jgi:hypothetical protein
MTWDLTKWGTVCKEVADFVTDAAEGFPYFSVGIGPDPEDLHDAGYRITIVAADAGEFDEPRYSGGIDSHPTFDEEIPVVVTVATKIDLDATTNLDKSPVLLERVVSRFLEGCDAVRHVPYLVPRRQRRRGGRIGEYGSKAIIDCVVRVNYYRTPAELGTATATTTTFGVEGPDGNGGTTIDSFEVIGNASP